MIDPHYASNISIGAPVKIILISDQTEKSGIVKEILSPLDYHPNGIKVKLEDLSLGRVSEILISENKVSEEILEKLKQPESNILEFKASLLTPTESVKEIMTQYKLKNNSEYESFISKIKKNIIHSCMKTVAAFANTDGGTLIIGVEDRTNKIIGLNNDFQHVLNNDDDGFLIELKNQIKSYFSGTGILAYVPTMEIISIDDKKICRIEVNPSIESFTISDSVETRSGNLMIEKFYVRISNSTEEFSAKDFYEKHWVNHKIKYFSKS
jgi:uncharacterized repeat protein (TIGR03833 family)